MERTVLERGADHTQVRLDLASQLRNKYRLREDEPLANILEETADFHHLLMVLFFNDKDSNKRSAAVMEGMEKEKWLMKLCSRESVKSITDSSFIFDVTGQRPRGMEALNKKVGHYRASRVKIGPSIESSFAEFESIRFTNSDMWRIQNMAAKLISDIMLDPQTIIIRSRTADVIGPKGRGVRILIDKTNQNNGSIFMGFIDTKLYTDPRNIPKAA